MTDLASLFPVFIKSMGFGLAVAAPVGPMSILCMRRSLTLGWRNGLATGFGIAMGDGLYAAVAALGLTGISAFMLAYDRPLHLAAGLFLLYLGLKTFWRSDDDGATAAPTSASTVRAFWGSLLLTLTNPPTIIMFAAIFAALAPKGGFDPASALATVGGVILGSLLWWCVIVGCVTAFRHALGRRVRLWIDRLAGSFLVFFGMAEIRRSL
ncbi:MAG: LysE family translocator [Parvibaculaceae bacterium]